MRSRGFNDSDGIRKICEQEEQAFSFPRSKTKKKMIPDQSWQIAAFHNKPIMLRVCLCCRSLVAFVSFPNWFRFEHALELRVYQSNP
jgi:hypothetical protein